jgi:hypothetical protein
MSSGHFVHEVTRLPPVPSIRAHLVRSGFLAPRHMGDFQPPQ